MTKAAWNIGYAIGDKIGEAVTRPRREREQAELAKAIANSQRVYFRPEQQRFVNELPLRLAIWGKANPLFLYRDYLQISAFGDSQICHASPEVIKDTYNRALAERMNPIIQEMIAFLNQLRRQNPREFQGLIAVLVKGSPVLGAIITGGASDPKREGQRHEVHKAWLMWLIMHCPRLFSEAYFELLCQFMPELNRASREQQLRNIDRLASNPRNRDSIHKSVSEGLDSWSKRDPKGCRQFRREVEFMRLSVRAAQEAARQENRPRWVSER